MADSIRDRLLQMIKSPVRRVAVTSGNRERQIFLTLSKTPAPAQNDSAEVSKRCLLLKSTALYIYIYIDPQIAPEILCKLRHYSHLFIVAVFGGKKLKHHFPTARVALPRVRCASITINRNKHSTLPRSSLLKARVVLIKRYRDELCSYLFSGTAPSRSTFVWRARIGCASKGESKTRWSANLNRAQSSRRKRPTDYRSTGADALQLSLSPSSTTVGISWAAGCH